MLGSGEVAFALGSLVVLSFVCLLYGNLQKARSEKSTIQGVTLILFKGLTWIASIVSVLSWLLVLVARATLSELPVDSWVIAASSTLVASPLILLLNGLTAHKDSEENLQIDTGICSGRPTNHCDARLPAAGFSAAKLFSRQASLSKVLERGHGRGAKEEKPVWAHRRRYLVRSSVKCYWNQRVSNRTNPLNSRALCAGSADHCSALRQPCGGIQYLRNNSRPALTKLRHPHCVRH